MACVERLELFLDCMQNKQSTVLQQIQDANTAKIKRNRQVLASICETVLFCGKQGIAFRGHRDDAKYLEDSETNPGNFQALLKFRMESGDDNLTHHFQTAQKSATYRSKTIQNELIQIIGGMLQQEIVKDVSSGMGVFSVNADEVQDVSNKEQLAICIRYVDKHRKFIYMSSKTCPIDRILNLKINNQTFQIL